MHIALGAVWPLRVLNRFCVLETVIGIIGVLAPIVTWKVLVPNLLVLFLLFPQWAFLGKTTKSWLSLMTVAVLPNVCIEVWILLCRMKM